MDQAEPHRLRLKGLSQDNLYREYSNKVGIAGLVYQGQIAYL